MVKESVYFVLQNRVSLIESSNSTVGRFIWYSRDIQVGHIEPFISTKVRLLLYQMEPQFSQNTIFCLKKPGRFRIHSKAGAVRAKVQVQFVSSQTCSRENDTSPGAFACDTSLLYTLGVASPCVLG